MATLELLKPTENLQQNVLIVDNITEIAFSFDATTVIFEKIDDNLIISFEDDSSLVLEHFYAIYDTDFIPSFIINNQEILGEDFFAALDESLMPAAGPVTGPVTGIFRDGARFYDTSTDSLADGVSSLDDDITGGSSYTITPTLPSQQTTNLTETVSSLPVIVPPQIIVISSVDSKVSMDVHDSDTLQATPPTSFANLTAAISSSIFISGQAGVTVNDPVYSNFALTILNPNTGMIHNGSPITLEVDSSTNDVLGMANGTEVFRVGLSADGELSMSLSEVITHLDSEGNHIPVISLPENLLSASATVFVSDSNNASSTQSFTIDLGGNLTFTDSAPSITFPNSVTPPVQTTDYNGLEVTFNYADYFTSANVDNSPDGGTTSTPSYIATLVDTNTNANETYTFENNTFSKFPADGVSTGIMVDTVYGPREMVLYLYNQKGEMYTDSNGNPYLKGDVWDNWGSEIATFTFTNTGIICKQNSTFLNDDFSIQLNINQIISAQDADKSDISVTNKVDVLQEAHFNSNIIVNSLTQDNLIVNTDGNVEVTDTITSFAVGSKIVGAKFNKTEMEISSHTNNSTYEVVNEGGVDYLNVTCYNGTYKVNLETGEYVYLKSESSLDTVFNGNGEWDNKSVGPSGDHVYLTIEHADGTKEVVELYTTFYSSVVDFGDDRDLTIPDALENLGAPLKLINISDDISATGYYTENNDPNSPDYGGTKIQNWSEWGGNDVLVGDKTASGAGNDNIESGAGNDIIFGDAVNADYLLSDTGFSTYLDNNSIVLENGDSFEILNNYLEYQNNGAPWQANQLREFIRDNYENLASPTAGGGDDTIRGGAGNDILIGGTGNDIFVWENEDFTNGTDQVLDVEAGEILDLSAFMSNSSIIQGVNFSNPDIIEFEFNNTQTNETQIINVTTHNNYTPDNMDLLDQIFDSNFDGMIIFR